MTQRLFCRVVWIVSALVLAGLTATFARQPLAIPVPAPMVPYSAEDKSLTLQHPGNWKPHQWASHGVDSGVRFDPNSNTRIIISVDLQGSLFADIAKAQNDQLSSLPGIGEVLAKKQKSPLETVHAMQAKELKREYADYQEGETKHGQVAGYEALMTPFTFKKHGLFGDQEMAGKRVSVLAGDRRLTIVYTCLKEMRAAFALTFEEMIQSLQLGQGQ